MPRTYALLQRFTRLSEPGRAAGNTLPMVHAHAAQRRGWSVNRLVLLASAYWLVTANRGFIAAALEGRNLGDASAWALGAALAVMVFAVHVLLLGLVCTRWTVKPVLALLLLGTAAASHFISAYGIYLDPTMLRNALRTDTTEAGELLTPALLLHVVLYAGLPLWLLWRVRLAPAQARHPLLSAAWRRLALLALALGLAVAAVLAVFQPFSSLMRNHKELRYLITPANFLWSAGAVVAAETKQAQGPRQPIGTDARPGPTWAGATRPRVVVLVLGETARAANWGLSGYSRNTTPQLAQLPVVNFPQVRACGTNTETSVPCMFAPVGRRDYDEARIRRQESLLHVVARAGTAVHWLDNQSGCKGVCDGLPSVTVNAANAPTHCTGERCMDEALVQDLDQRLAALQAPAQGASGAAGTSPPTAPPTVLWVLHMLGNHGPAYHKRYPPAYARFQPACNSDDLRQCSVPEIVNAYDNALLYTDHVLATAIQRLQAHADRVDSSLIYVSDHGESLGEKGLFLHGMPYAIAPREQTRVPMLWWASAGFEAAAGLKPGCLQPSLQAQAQREQSHDVLFHSLLGLLDVRTALHEPALDLTSACRAQP